MPRRIKYQGGSGPFGGGVRARVDSDLGGEAYRLTVGPDGAEIVGGDEAGIFWGRQTLRQLLGPDSFRRAPIGDPADVPYVIIEDRPRFGWRGFMLDVARHFMPKDGVLRYVDLLAAHKLNVLHLHLTDDQGWRVEIKRHPRLTEVGAWRRRSRRGWGRLPDWDERPHGGFYTQDDLREIVAYAAERHITVVPEIDIPGHSQAAIAAYPELGNADVVDVAAVEVKTDWGVSPNVLNAAESTLRFYEGVLTEILEIFPGTFVHLGGDECLKDQWRRSPAAQARIRELGVADEYGLQSWIIRHFDRWLAERGRRLAGWDEILEGGLAEGATVTSWRSYEAGIAAALAGHDVVMCPRQTVYLDYRQSGDAGEPVPVGKITTLEDVYRFDVVPPGLAGTPHEARVLGAQANMWTEAAETPQRVDYQTFPRLVAFAEAVWSEERDFESFKRRMDAAHYARLDALGVAYRPPEGPRPWDSRTGAPGQPR
ncbi:beta-N-acetylhexosaminidase [Actinomadura rudentiformis]|uniref:beta-N-acetylhexosaminidase n=1 Tax=Actinomadura rudentiformis TaxID=359158 RepID=A0A6H9YHA8_9ACTN|nr:beta-N-acetylhexosaminidase [Actinomadura rudentiformis]KAB2344431.1 beta-N-acetylhexosaminidase [Actinomadura rudentiformis]